MYDALVVDSSTIPMSKPPNDGIVRAARLTFNKNSWMLSQKSEDRR